MPTCIICKAIKTKLCKKDLCKVCRNLQDSNYVNCIICGLKQSVNKKYINSSKYTCNNCTDDINITDIEKNLTMQELSYTSVNETNFGDGNDLDSSSSNLIRIGVNFVTQLNYDPETPTVLSESEDIDYKSSGYLESTRDITLDINDNMQIIIEDSNNTSEHTSFDSYTRNHHDIITVHTKDGGNANLDANISIENIADLRKDFESAFNKLYEMVDSLKEELQDKYRLVRTLLVRDAENYGEYNKSDKSNENTTFAGSIADSNYSISENINNSTEDSSNETSINDDRYHQSIKHQLQNYRATQNQLYESYKETEKNKSPIVATPAYWELHTTGFGRRLMEKMNYSGGGLGKSENGIVSPIKITQKFGRGAIDFDQNPQYINRGLEKLANATINSNKIPMNRVKNNIHPWPKNTTLITGSSIISGIEENKLTKYKAKVRVFPGALTDDMYDNLQPLLKRKPTNIILHIGSNDSTSKTSDEIMMEIENLKIYIKQILPNVNLFLSCPVVRFDNTEANFTLRKLDQKLKSTRNIIMNDNVDKSCVGKKGLHLNAKGSGRLATNFISLMRRL